jgi:Zn-dependent protease with chaperone function
MTELLFLAALALLLVPVALGGIGHGLAHPERTRLMVGSLAAGITLVEFGLILTAAPTVLRAFHMTDLAAVCERLAGHVLGGNAAVGWAAGALALMLPGLALIGAWRSHTVRHRMRAESWVGTHSRLGPHELVVLPTPAMLALSVPGKPGQILLSEGLMNALKPKEVEAILRHEAAHLDLRHGSMLTIVSMVQWSVGWLPIMRRSLSSLRLSLEQWADAVAVKDLGSSQPLLAALRSYVSLAASPYTAGFSAVETIGRRVHALAKQPLESSAGIRCLSYSVVGGLGAAATGALIVWISHAHQLAIASPYCPI